MDLNNDLKCIPAIFHSQEKALTEKAFTSTGRFSLPLA